HTKQSLYCRSLLSPISGAANPPKISRCALRAGDGVMASDTLAPLQHSNTPILLFSDYHTHPQGHRVQRYTQELLQPWADSARNSRAVISTLYMQIIFDVSAKSQRPGWLIASPISISLKSMVIG